MKYSVVTLPFYFFSIFLPSLGALFVLLEFDPYGRLNDISNNAKILGSIGILWSSVCVFLFVCLFNKYGIINKEKYYIEKIKRGDLSYRKEHKYYAFLVLLFSVMGMVYSLIIYSSVGFFKAPIVLALKGEVEEASMVRMLIQTHELRPHVPYARKFFEFGSVLFPVLSLALAIVTKKNKYNVLFLVCLLPSLLILLFDGQKAPLFYLFFLIIYGFYILGASKRLFLFIAFSLAFFAIYLYGVFMGGGHLVSRFLDRLVLGQIQGVYFMIDNITPSLHWAFSDLFFSSFFGLKVEKPDEVIASIVYPGQAHIVNVNTHYSGEAWAFFGYFGILISPILISFIIVAYSFFCNRLIRNYRLLGLTFSLLFFTTLPLTQSLQFIIYQKYFAYYFVFLLMPCVIFLYFLNKIKLIEDQHPV